MKPTRNDDLRRAQEFVMLRANKHLIFAVLLASFLNLGAGVADASAANRPPHCTPSYLNVFADVLLVRPLGFGATVLGAAVTFVTLPFTIPGGNVRATADKLIVEPAMFTFARPAGEFYESSCGRWQEGRWERYR